MDSTEYSVLAKELSKPSRTQIKDVSFLRRKRYRVAFMVFLGMVIVTELGTNFVIIFVDLTNEKNITMGDQIITQEPEIKWSRFEKAILLSGPACMFIFGLLGGLLSRKYGGAKVFGLSIFLNAVSSIFSPFILKTNFILFFITGLLHGLFHIITFGSVLQVLMKWSPSSEQFRMINFSFSGCLVGTTITFPLCGMILQNMGWQCVYYLSGLVGVVWYIIWAIFIYDDPMEDKFISKDEKHFIVQNVETISKKLQYPWKKILKSKAVWAYLNERFVEAWSMSLAIWCLPMYIKDSFDVSIAQIGFISSAPHICNFLGMLIGGPIADFLRNRNILPSSKVYTVLIAIGQSVSVISLLVMGLYTNFVLSIFCICILRFMYGIAESAYIVLPIDIVGEYASLVHGLGFSVFAIGAVLNPILMSFMIANKTSEEWCNYFLVLSIFNIWGFAIFYFFGSAETEPWLVTEKKSNSRQSSQI